MHVLRPRRTTPTHQGVRACVCTQAMLADLWAVETEIKPCRKHEREERQRDTAHEAHGNSKVGHTHSARPAEQHHHRPLCCLHRLTATATACTAAARVLGGMRTADGPEDGNEREGKGKERVCNHEGAYYCACNRAVIARHDLLRSLCMCGAWWRRRRSHNTWFSGCCKLEAQEIYKQI